MVNKRFRQDSSIAIVGGSLTGPTLALLLMRAGFTDVSIYEALPGAVPQAGGVIGLDHVSLGILDTIDIDQEEIIPYASERVVSVKVLDRRDLKRVYQLWPGRNTTWNLLHGALMAQLPTEVYNSSRRVIGLDTDGGRAALQFAIGEPVEADLIAFADGRRSIGRGLLDPRRPLRYAGYVAHRGQVEYTPPSARRDFVRYEPMHSQFNIFPVPFAGQLGVDWTFYLPAPLSYFREIFGGEPQVRTFITSRQIGPEARQEVDQAAARLLPEAQADIVHRTRVRAAIPILDIAPPRRMMVRVGNSLAVMLGDALAPVRPHTARGANNGIEEAAGLALALSQSSRFGSDLRTALRGWQTRSLPMVADSLRRGPEIARTLGL